MTQQLKQLQELISCEIKTDYTTLVLYSTDASAYRQKPVAVVYPADKKDIKTIITFCNEHKINIIFRGAGTSLAGQVVGEGIVVDISKHFCRIKQINAKENYVWAEPGVVRDVLNHELKQYNKFFAPETSTSNRCTLGGMVGNNSCGLHSVAWETTRNFCRKQKAVPQIQALKPGYTAIYTVYAKMKTSKTQSNLLFLTKT